MAYSGTITRGDDNPWLDELRQIERGFTREFTGTIDSSQIPDKSIVERHIGYYVKMAPLMLSGSVNAEHVIPGSLNYNKANTLLTGSQIAAGAIQSYHLASGITIDLSPFSVTTGNFMEASVTPGKLDGTTLVIGTGVIGSLALDGTPITEGKIASNTLTGNKFADGVPFKTVQSWTPQLKDLTTVSTGITTNSTVAYFYQVSAIIYVWGQINVTIDIETNGGTGFYITLPGFDDGVISAYGSPTVGTCAQIIPNGLSLTPTTADWYGDVSTDGLSINLKYANMDGTSGNISHGNLLDGTGTISFHTAFLFGS